MHRKSVVGTWTRLLIATSLATSLGVALGSSGGQAALQYDPSGTGGTGGIGELTRFQIDGDPVPGISSNGTPGPGVTGDWGTHTTGPSPVQLTPFGYGPVPIGTVQNAKPPLGIGSTGTLPLTFTQSYGLDFPTVSPAPNPQYPVIDPVNQFCGTGLDDTWTGGTKAVTSLVDINNPLFGVGGTVNLGCGQTLDKGDLFAAYAAYEIVSIPKVFGNPASGSQNHVILYGAWERGAVAGELNFYIPIADGVPGNSPGDRLIAFDYNSSSPDQFRVLKWNAAQQQWVVDTSGLAGANSPTFQTAVGYADGSAFPANGRPSFGEFALDLTATGVLPDGSTGACVQLTTAGYIFTETGNSSNAQLKDYVIAPKLPIGNCGAFDVIKAGPANANDTLDFNYRVRQIDDAAIFPAAATPVGQTPTQINDTVRIGPANRRSWTGVYAQPDYLVYEPDVAPYELPLGWTQIKVDCTYIDQFTALFPQVTTTVYNGDATAYVPGTSMQVQSYAFLVLAGKGAFDPNGVYSGFRPSCTITNSFTGFNVTKAGTGDTDQLFDITIDVDGSSSVEALTIGDTTDLIPTSAGQIVTIDEPTLPATTPGWVLDSIVCSDSNGPVTDLDLDASDTSVQFEAVSGEAVNCVVTNDQQAQITVAKVTDPVTDPNVDDTFDFQFGAGPSVISDITGIGHGESGNTGDIVPGTYTIDELLPPSADPAWQLTNVLCGGVDVTDTIATVGVTVAAGEIVTCTFTNTQDGRIVVQKETVDGDDTFSFTGDVVGAITTSGGVGTTTLSADVSPGDSPFSVSETAKPGYTLTNTSCDDGSLVGAIGVSAGETVTCTFTNTRNSATFTLQKAWGADTLPGEVVDLDAAVQLGAAPNTQTIDTTATSPNGAAPTNTMTVYSNQTVRFDEAFQTAGAGDNYTTSLACFNTDTLAPITFTPDAGNRGGTYATGNVPVNVTCRFTNAPKVSGVALQKSWVDAKDGDTAGLSLSTDGSLDSDSATSTASDAPLFIGPDDTRDNTAFVSVQAGETVTFTEDLGTAGVNYTTTFACTGATNTPVQGADSREWTLLIDTADVTSGDTIFCEFTNERIKVDLVLEKDWDDAKVGDTVTMSATGSDTTPISYQSAAGTVDETDTSTAFTVYAGETLSLSESWDIGDAAAYDKTLSCDGVDAAGDGQLTIDATDTVVTCTWVNARRSVDVVVAKDVRPDDDDGSFDVTLNGQPALTGVVDGVDVDPDAAPDASSLAVPIFIGDSVALVETAAAGAPALTNYTSTLTCDNDIVPTDNTGVSGEFVVPSTLASGTEITCTFVNTRKSADLVLTKTWGNSPVDDEVVGLSISGGLDAAPVAGINHNDDGTLLDVDAESVVYYGETGIVVTEVFDVGDASNYDISLECVADGGTPLVGDDDSPVTVTPGASVLTGSIDIPSDLPAGSTITCTFTNERKSADLVLRKLWYNAAVDDAALLTVSGELGQTPGQATSTVLVAAPSIFDVTNTATLKVYAGETVSLGEDLGAAGSKYNSTLKTGALAEGQCANATNPATGSGRSWTLAIDPLDAGKQIACTLENRRKSLTLRLDKDWLQSPANGDAVDMTLTGGFATASPGSLDDPATNSNNGTADDEIGSITAYFGETITLAEVFAATGLDETYYTSGLTCGVDGAYDTMLTYTDGELTGDFSVDPDDPLIAAAEDGSITCTFSNQRNSSTLTLSKVWDVNAPATDSVSIEAGGGVSTTESIQSTAPVGETTSDLTVYSGETITVSETFSPGVSGDKYLATLECSGEVTVSTLVTITSGVATYDLPELGPDPVATSCTFTNDLRTATVVVQKNWIDGRAGDRAELSVSGINPAETATSPATSDNTGPDTTNQAILGVFAGETIDFGEDLVTGDDPDVVDVSALYTSSWSCGNSDDEITSGTGTSGSLLITAALADPAKTITCTITNERKTATLQLTKDWKASPASADTVELRVGPTDEPLATATSTSNLPPASPAEVTVLVGESYDLSEVFTSGSADNYDSGWACDNDAASSGDGTSGAVAVDAADAGSTVLCTFSNDRKSTTLTLQKRWVDGAPGDSATLTITPTLTDPDSSLPAVVPVDVAGTGLATETVSRTVYAGESIGLDEAFGTNDGTYDVTGFACPATTNGVAGWTGADDLDGTLLIDPLDTAEPITCTIENTRKSGTFTLVKVWNDPLGAADANEAVDVTLDAAGDDANVGNTMTQLEVSSPVGGQRSITVFAGETVSFDETFVTPAEADLFTTTLVCNDVATQFTVLDGELSASVPVDDVVTDVTCTFTNTRKRTQMTLQKTWIDSFADDSYGLEIDGTGVDPAAPVPSVAPGGTGLGTGSTSITVYAGEQVTLTETAGGANTGSYDVSGFTCTAAGSSVGADATTKLFDVDAINVTTDPITCTFENTRTSAEFTLAKTWDDPVGGAGVTLHASGSDPLSGVIEVPLTSPTGGSKTITVYSGETISYDETFGDAADVARFTTTLTCNTVDTAYTVTDAVLSGSWTVPADPVDTTCTFDNYRKRTDLTLAKAWEQPVTGDTVDLSIDGTADDGPTTVTAPDTTPVVSSTVYAGETVTLSEAIDDANNTAIYDVTGFTCDDPSDNLDWSGALGDTDATLLISVANAEADAISCQITNRARRGNITIVKNIAGNDGPFDFDGTWLDPTAFQITTTGGTGQITFTDVLVPWNADRTGNGSYTVSEDDLAPAFGTTVSCSNADATTASSPTTPTAALEATIGLDHGETVTCTFNNTENGTVIIEKIAVPDDDPQDFSFTTDLPGGDFQLDDDSTDITLADTNTVINVVPGSYDLAEVAQDGWDLTALACVDGDSEGVDSVTVLADGTATINVDAAETVTCTFTNTKRATITVDKVTVPAEDPTVFDFEHDIVTDGTFTLTDAADPFESGFILPSQAYTVTELAETNWALTEFECLGGENVVVYDVDGDPYDIDGASATITPKPGEDIVCTVTNNLRGPVEIAKTALGPVTRDGETYTVAFDLEVTTQSTVTEAFTLNDVPTFASGVIIQPPTITDPDSNPITLPYDGTIDPGETLNFTATFTFTMAGFVAIDDRTCDGSGTGTFNTATVTSYVSSDGQTSTACVPLPDPEITVTKTTAITDPAQPVYLGGNTYSVAYDVVATNSGEGPGSYTITEAPDFGAGITVTGISATSSDAIVSATFGLVDPVLIADEDLAAGESDAFVVTITFTIDGAATPAARDCGGPGTASYNSVSLVYNGITGDPANACVPLPDPEITVAKTAIVDPAQPEHVSSNTYTATYTVTVDNIGEGPGSYTLVDTPDLGVGATVTNIAVTGNGVDIDQAGPGPVTIISAESIDPDEAAHVYTVTVTFTVAGDMTTEARACTVDVLEAGFGAYNGADVTYNGGLTDEDDDCVDIPEPVVSIDKTVDPAGQLARELDGSWTVSYLLEVTNSAGAGPADYDLTDSFDFPAGVTVNTVTVEIVESSAVDGDLNPDFDGDLDTSVVSGVLITDGDVHTYRVTVNVDIEIVDGTNGACNDEGGLLNTMSVSVRGDQPLTDPACDSFSILTLQKVLVNDDGGNATIGQFVLSADGGPTPISGTVLVSEAVLTGTYDLSETEIAGYTTEGFACGDVEMDGNSVFVADGANVACTITNDDEPVDLQLTKDDGGVTAIAGGAAFTYTITVENVGPRALDVGEPVTVTDELPTGLVWVTPLPAGCTQSGQTLTCTVSPAAINAGPVVITASVRAPATTASGVYVNEAWVTTQDDPACVGAACVPPPCDQIQGNNNVDCESTPVDRRGAIQILKTDDVANGVSVESGETFKYTLVVKNTGVSTILPGLVVSDDLPASLVFVSVSGGAGWTCNNADPIECTYAPALAPGASAPAITVTVRVAETASGSSITNVASVIGAVDRECAATLAEAFVPACNQVTDTDDEVTPLVAVADLAILKSVSAAQVGAGGGFDWVLDITNNGPGRAVNVVIGDLVPAEVVVQSVTSSQFACSNTGNAVKCTVASLAVGATGKVTIAVTVPANAAGGTIDNVGTVESDTPDPNLDNNSDDASIIVVAQAPPTQPPPPPVTLPRTGSDATLRSLQIAVWFVLLGAAAVVGSRRRRVQPGRPVSG